MRLKHADTHNDHKDYFTGPGFWFKYLDLMGDKPCPLDALPDGLCAVACVYFTSHLHLSIRHQQFGYPFRQAIRRTRKRRPLAYKLLDVRYTTSL